MNIIRVGVDIAKSVFHVHGVDRHDKTQWQGKYARQKWLDALSRKVPVGAEIGKEACASSHYWARELQKRGCCVRLIAAQFVKPYVKSNKNDRVDAETICEAMSRPNMRYVALKTVARAAHRIREALVEQRTAKATQIWGLVASMASWPRWAYSSSAAPYQDGWKTLRTGSAMASEFCSMVWPMISDTWTIASQRLTNGSLTLLTRTLWRGV